MEALQISRTGLEVEWRRLEIIAENLANAGSTRAGGGEAYRAQRLVSGPRFADHLSASAARRPSGVAVYGVETAGLPARRVHEPAHPHADAQGWVTYPGLDHAGEMTLMVTTARAYEANIVAMNTARQMYAKALELGRR
ncbi:MAG TPA: flagellar basal body rod protein FlgC [Caulobacteraceae bacterium]|nr:flagellar basal body rod protein FlgC [Caulobacteraceae bacterium]